MRPELDRNSDEGTSSKTLGIFTTPKFLGRHGTLMPTSFLQSKIESEATTLTTALMWTKLLSTKKRKTKDGRKCANAFVQDGQTFTDCTATKSPDGLMTCA